MIACLLLSSCSSYQAAPVSDRSTPHSDKSKIHVVAAGETLFSIARRYGVNYTELADFNRIKSPYTVYPGQKIYLNLTSSKSVAADSEQNPGRAGIVAKKQSSQDKNNTSASSYRSNNQTNKNSSDENSQNIGSTPKWQWPCSGKLIALFEGEKAANKGIDLSGKLGEPVMAAAAGQVVYAGGGLRGYGKLLIIKHNETFLSAYAHNNELLVKEGDFVKAGQRIADMGSSGTDRVKLHFEIRSEGNPVDPLKYLPKH